MDSKKRPNEDVDETDKPIDAVSVNADMINPLASSVMDVDGPKDEPKPTLLSPASGTAATMIAETMAHGGEANKRLKLTKEADRLDSDYSPSTDLRDPSQETKGFAEWVGKMEHTDQDDPSKGKRILDGGLICSTPRRLLGIVHSRISPQFAYAAADTPKEMVANVPDNKRVPYAVPEEAPSSQESGKHLNSHPWRIESKSGQRGLLWTETND